MRKHILYPAILASGLLLGARAPVTDASGPVLTPTFIRIDGDIRNLITWEQLHAVTEKDGNDLTLDLGGTGLEGKVAKICSGPYPFEFGEADYDYARYRYCRDDYIEVDEYLQDKYNANGWPNGQCKEPSHCPSMTIGYRLVTNKGDFYDGRVSFTGKQGSIKPITTITEGPLLNMVRSDDTSGALITFETNAVCSGHIAVDGLGKFSDPAATLRHEIEITGLEPNRRYEYQVSCDDTRSGRYSFMSAPEKGSDKGIRFAFASDSREGPAGEESFMGVNFKVLSRIAANAHRRRADLFIFGGDLINGYTLSPDDFRMQLKAWKKAMEGFWRSRPVYPAMGNHETLVDVYDDGSEHGILMDKRPYPTDSAEAIFADEFRNPRNGPDATGGRPAYKENVYSFQYGPIFFIAFNNNYWWTTNEKVSEYGGAPEGYILPEQLDWIEAELARAEGDDTIRYIFLYAQEPVFPAGGHVKDVMWWNGDNNVKSYEYDGANVVPAGPGIIETRNRLWRAVADSAKVAAVMNGDEHAYHRTRIDSNTPVGVMSDDTNGDGVINWDGEQNESAREPASPNPDFRCPTWHLSAGSAGVPWYARENTPWDVEIFSSRISYPLFETNGDGSISVTVHSLDGQEIDHVPDLMAIKKECRN
uniref:Calcineurin-like phosphoesterase n=1 Tax=Candidatus Kentrum eta TaxID=2126337 RepID=A0A450UIX2_9GAMM|nr:MAG: Calcineurin-like phosphoesterase [Candidatus Kentron sp. H]VFJ93381.1 MAG: Calcineurin-like phosphoesterase [Candidatus Kentron sp. H]VFK00186.1 MAG: Calcineurin-like phosphoesterase [Candidatus Kentron sp. H]